MKIIFVLLFLTSCGGILSNYTINKLEYGQSQREVERLLSKPAEKRIVDENKEIYIYYVHDSILDLFLSPRFPFIGFYPINRTGEEFWLLFEYNSLVKTSKRNDLKFN